MNESIVLVIRTGAKLALFSIMFAQGLNLTRQEIAFVRKRPALLLRSLLAVDVLVPLAILLVVVLMKPSLPVQVGLAIMAASPAAPLTLVNAPKAGGAREYAASLQLHLAALAVITAPITLALFSRVIGFEASVPALGIARQVAIGLLLPVGLGIALRAAAPRLAGRIREPLERAGWLVLTATVLLIVVRNGEVLARVDPRSYAAMALVVVAALAIGQAAAPPTRGERITLALESAVRNPGLAVFIATHNYPIDRVVPVLIPYLVVSVVISGLYRRMVGVRTPSVA